MSLDTTWEYVVTGTHGCSGVGDGFVEPFSTLALTPLLIGAHEEGDDWRHTRKALAHTRGVAALGVPFRGAVALHTDGSIEPFLRPVTLLLSTHRMADATEAAGTMRDAPIALAVGRRHRL